MYYKWTVILLFVFILSCSTTYYTKLPNGEGDLKWGSSMLNVMDKYDVKESQLEKLRGDDNIVYFKIKMDWGTIIYSFYKERFYSKQIMYSLDVNPQDTLKKLKKKYGKPLYYMIDQNGCKHYQWFSKDTMMEFVIYNRKIINDPSTFFFQSDYLILASRKILKEMKRDKSPGIKAQSYIDNL